MKRLYPSIFLAAIVISAIAATVKISDLPISTSPSTNTFIEIADMNAVTKSSKYLLTNLVTVAQGQASTNALTNTFVLKAGDSMSGALTGPSSTWTNGITAGASTFTNNSISETPFSITAVASTTNYLARVRSGTTNHFLIESTGDVSMPTDNGTVGLSIGASAFATSTDPAIHIKKDMGAGTGNAHGFVDETRFRRDGPAAYNSFDALAQLAGDHNWDHYAAFQSAGGFNPGSSNNTCVNLYGFYNSMIAGLGTLTTNTGVYLRELTGSTGIIKNNFGIFIEALTRGTNVNYAIYTSGSTPSYLGGNVTVGGAVFENPQAAIIYKNDFLVSQDPAWNNSSSSGGAANAGSSLAMGTALMTSGASTGNYGAYRAGDANYNNWLPGLGETTVKTRVYLNQLSTAGNEAFSFKIGFCDTLATNDTDCIKFIYSHAVNGGNWTMETTAGGVTETNSNTAVQATTWYDLAFTHNTSPTTNVVFSINGSTVWTNTTITAIPSTTSHACTPLIFTVKQGTGGTTTANVDFWYQSTKLYTAR